MEANIAYYCLHKLHKWPHEFLSLDRYEQAVVIASIQIKLEADKKQQRSMRRPRKK